MGSTQSICKFVGVKQTPTYIKIKLEDGSVVLSEIDSYVLITDVGSEVTILDQAFNYAVKTGLNITTEQANTFMSKKGFPILTNGSQFGLFRVFGHHGEYTMKECLTFFPENSVKAFCFAFKGNCNGFTIPKSHGNITISLGFLKSFLEMKNTFDATSLSEFPAPQAGKAPVAASSQKVSTTSSWVSVAKSNTSINAVVPPPTLEDIQDEEVKLNAQLAALSLKKELAKKALAEELKLLEEEEKVNKARELAIKERQAKLKLVLQSN
jgi:hypothetical protein